MPKLAEGFGSLELIVLMMVLAVFTGIAADSLRQMSQILARIKQNDNYVFQQYEKP